MHKLLVNFAILFLGSCSIYGLLLASKSLWKPFRYLFHIPRTDGSRTVLLLGGLPIFLASFAAVIYQMDNVTQVLMWAIPASILAIAGYIDDKVTLRPSAKLGAQIVAVGVFAILASSANNQINLTEFFLYMFWGLGVINGSNLLDGIDTYSAKYSIGSLIGFALLSYHIGQENISSLSIMLMAPITAFYYFNKSPAKIFLGEIGVSIIGFNTMFLVSSLYHSLNFNYMSEFNLSQFFLIVTIAHLPMTELGISLLRRAVCFRSSPFIKDNTHLHHILTRENKYSHSKSSNILFAFHFSAIVLHLLTATYINPVISFWTTGMYYVGYYLSFGLKYWLPETLIAKSSKDATNTDNVVELAQFRTTKEVSEADYDEQVQEVKKAS